LVLKPILCIRIREHLMLIGPLISRPVSSSIRSNRIIGRCLQEGYCIGYLRKWDVEFILLFVFKFVSKTFGIDCLGFISEHYFLCISFLGFVDDAFYQLEEV
jgi:hypothetical protein